MKLELFMFSFRLDQKKKKKNREEEKPLYEQPVQGAQH